MRLHPVLPSYVSPDNPRWLAAVVTSIPLLLAVIVVTLPARVWIPFSDWVPTHALRSQVRSP